MARLSYEIRYITVQAGGLFIFGFSHAKKNSRPGW